MSMLLLRDAIDVCVCLCAFVCDIHLEITWHLVSICAVCDCNESTLSHLFVFAVISSM